MKDKLIVEKKSSTGDKEGLETIFMGMMEKLAEMKAHKEEKLWRAIKIDGCLTEVLGDLTKDDLNKIRINLQIKNISNLKKQQLIEHLAVEIPTLLSTLATVIFDEERYNWFKKIAENGGYLYSSKMPLDMVIYFRERGLLFTGIHQNKKVIVMPSEVLLSLQQLDDGYLANYVKRNTEWICFTHGLLYYYGVLSFIGMQTMLEELIGGELDSCAYASVMVEAMNCYKQVGVTASGYFDERVDDAEYILFEQKRREDISYYPFTKGQLLKAGKFGYLEKSAGMEDFIKFMSHGYELSQVEEDELAEICVQIINNDQGVATLFEYLQENYEIENADLTQKIGSYLTVMYNQTRLWVLKGYKPDELTKKEYLAPLMGSPILQATPILNIPTGQKVGRNDFCPCNSGKKFKKCCGK